MMTCKYCGSSKTESLGSGDNTVDIITHEPDCEYVKRMRDPDWMLTNHEWEKKEYKGGIRT